MEFNDSVHVYVDLVRPRKHPEERGSERLARALIFQLVCSAERLAALQAHGQYDTTSMSLFYTSFARVMTLP